MLSYFMNKLFISAFLLLFFIAGCDNADKAPRKNVQPEKTLIIGLLPEQNVFHQLERYEPLAKYISGKIGMKIELRILPRYGNIINNFVSEEMDGAFFGSFTYALAHSRLGLEVIARPESAEGVSTYHGLMFARKDSGIRTIKDMKGKRLALVDKATTAGYLLPLAYFQKNGIENYKNYLRESYFAGTHEDVIYDVLNRKADIGAAKNTVFYRLAQKDKRILNELIIFAKSPEVPENGLAMRKDLDISIKTKLKDILLDMHNDPAGRNILKDFGALKFIPTSNDDYNPVFEYAKEIGLNLATYDYLNE
jgi:phosphonate transport system substrate-binding protein